MEVSSRASSASACIYILQRDFSLAEIGEELGITRQAAHDNIRRAERALAEMEETLGLFARQQGAGAGDRRRLCGAACASRADWTRGVSTAVAEELERYTSTE